MSKHKQLSKRSLKDKFSRKKINKGDQILNNCLKEANKNAPKYLSQLNDKSINQIKQLLQYNHKSVCTALFSLLTYKLVDPSQDIRLAQTSFHDKKLNGKGFSARSFDTKCTTPFIRENHFTYANTGDYKMNCVKLRNE